MHKSQWTIIFISVALATLVLPSVPSACAAEKSAYDSLDSSQLSASLRQLGMKEILAQLGRELGSQADMPEGKALAAEIKIAGAAEIVDSIKRLKAMDEAIAMLAQATKDAKSRFRTIRRKPGITDEARVQATIDYYRMRFKLANVLGRTAVQPHVRMILLLQDNESDKQVVREYTERAVGVWDKLRGDIESSVPRWRRMMKVWVVRRGEIERLQQDIAYGASWTYLYRALAMGELDPDDKEERGQLFEDVTVTLQDIRGGRAEDLGVRKYLAMWMSAVADRDLGNQDDALKLLNPKLYAKASGSIRSKIAMEVAFTHIIGGKFDLARKSADDYERIAVKAIGKGMQFEVQRALLLNAMYLSWAQATKDIGAKNTHLAASQKPLVDFLSKHQSGNVRRAFLRLFANRWKGRKDTSAIPSVHVYALASQIVAADRKSPQAGKLYAAVIARKDNAARAIRPLVLWDIAISENNRNHSLKAAAYFAQLAKNYPKSKRAAIAADHAATCEWSAVRAREKKGTTVSVDLRKRCVEMMKLAVGFVKERPQVASWYFSMAVQCDKLSWDSVKPADQAKWIKEAIAAFDNVPAKPIKKRMEAEGLSLSMKYRLLKAGDKGIDAAKLRTALKAYSDKVSSMSRVNANSAFAGDLKRQAAWSDYYAARILGDKLGKPHQAIAELRLLAKKWVGQVMLVSARQYEIQKLVEVGKVDAAIAGLNEFRKTNAAGTSQLIDMVIREIRSSIVEMVDEGGNQGRLTEYRKAYLSFAAELHNRRKSVPLVERMDEALLYVDALNQNARGGEALALVLKCKEIEDARRAKASVKIEARYKASVAKAGKLTGKKLDKAASDFFARVKKLGYKDVEEEFSGLSTTLSVFRQTDGVDANRKKRRTQALVQELNAAGKRVKDDRKRSVAVRMELLLNLARSYRASEEYEKAVRVYDRLARGLDGESGTGRKLFFQMELELCQTMMEKYGKTKDKQWLEVMLLRVGQLRRRSAEMASRQSREFDVLDATGRKLMQ